MKVFPLTLNCCESKLKEDYCLIVLQKDKQNTLMIRFGGTTSKMTLFLELSDQMSFSLA